VIVLLLFLAVQAVQPDPCATFDRLYARIRDGAIAREAALTEVGELLPRIRDEFRRRGGVDAPESSWVFPVEGYDARSIGGINGSGYVTAGYDYFDGFKSRGHPGHDIFIHDADRDSLDDGTGAPVHVRSISSGIVVAFSPDWKSGSVLRGGRYVYIYDPGRDALFYYAHNRDVLVKPGDLVTPGQVIANVGRTGRNASAARSPTHLHVMYLAIVDGYPKPRDLFETLSRLGRSK
jgi:murein DD-endopeptidase MepM/ murein hydrolase activator NlpD